MAQSKGSKNLILSGTFNQIEAAHKLLQFLIRTKGGKGSVYYGGKTTKTRDLDELSSVTANITEPSSFEVQPQFMKLLKRVRKTNLQDIKENFGVVIVWDENASQVRINPGKLSNGQNRFQEGCDAFIDLYQKFHPNIGRELVELPNEANDALVLEAVSFVQSKTPAIIENVENNLVVYAEKAVISSSVHALKEKLGVTKNSGSRKTRRGQGNKSRNPDEDNQALQQGRFPLPKHLNQVLKNGVGLSLYQGDITDERVGAIVNAANEWLQHGAGVAAAIVRKGGRQIQHESNEISRQRGPLSVGEAVHTSGGTLPCHYVIHTVGPRWNEHGREKCISLLGQACMESLRLAAQLELSSIALTAISSGIFGMPKDICAQVMFKAVEEFSSSVDAEFSTIRDVRIVIIDQPTISVFHEEFVKRYHSQEPLSETVTNQGRPPDEDRKTSPAADTKNNQCHSRSDDSFDSVDRITSNNVKPSHGKRKQNGEVESLGKGAFGDEETSDQIGVPENITQMSLSNQAPDNAVEAKLPTTVKTPKLEGNSRHAQKDSDSAPAEKFNLANKRTAIKPPFGRGRGNIAATFPGKERSLPSGSIHLQENTADSAEKGTDVISKTATTTTLPPGLTVTEEGKNLASQLGERVKDDRKPEGELPEDVNKAEQTDPSNKYVQEVSESNKLNIGGVDVNEESKTKTTTDRKTSSQSNANKYNASGDKSPPGEQAACTDLEEPLERSGSDESTKLRAVKNAENVIPESHESKGMQTHVHKEEVPGSVSNTRNDGFMSPQDPLVSGNTTKEIQAEIERSAEHGSITSSPESSPGYPALPQSVNVLNGEARGETKDVERKTSQASSTGTQLRQFKFVQLVVFCLLLSNI